MTCIDCPASVIAALTLASNNVIYCLAFIFNMHSPHFNASSCVESHRQTVVKSSMLNDKLSNCKCQPILWQCGHWYMLWVWRNRTVLWCCRLVELRNYAASVISSNTDIIQLQRHFIVTTHLILFQLVVYNNITFPTSKLGPRHQTVNIYHL